MKTDYHEFAVSMTRELFPDLYKAVQQHVGATHPDISSGYRAIKDTFDMKVSIIERNIWALIAPLEAAANHDISPHVSLETTIRELYRNSIK